MIVRLPPQEVIYHYTNLTALESILKTRCLWMSHSACLNDTSEGMHGIRIVFQRLKKNYAKHLSSLESHEDDMKKAIQHEGFYVMSFCGSNDVLSQWRGYADNHVGVAIGISSDFFKERFKNDPLYLFGLCGYVDAQQADIFREVVKKMKVGEHSHIDHSLIAIAMASAFMKHPAFREEQESRIVVGPGGKKSYRMVSDRVIPYHELFLGDDYSWLKEVRVGPGQQQVAVKVAVEAMLEKLGVNSEIVTRSDIPYRGQSRG